MGSRVKTLVYPVWITRAELKEGGRRDLVHRPTTYSMSFQFDHLHTLEKKKDNQGKAKREHYAHLSRAGSILYLLPP